MPVERIPITDRESWLALRRQDVTASAVGAIFGVHPYQSLYSLYAAKTGLQPDEETSPMLEWRLILESAVGAAVERDNPGWRIVKATDYLRDTDLRIGATIDFYIEGDPRGLGVLQAKTAAPSSFKKQWTDGQPPFWIALQNATEMMLEHEAEWGAVACLIIDPWKCECPLYEIPRHEGVEARIRDGVARFWDDVAAGREPAPDYVKDAALIARLMPDAVPLKTIDLSGDNLMPTLLAERAEIRTRIAIDEARCADIEAEIKHKMRDAEIGTIDGFTIKFKHESRKGGFVAPSNPRVLRITEHRSSTGDLDDGPF
ncbi:YqaJ viral recombinase family nuclease [Klebsiella pneumoniae]